MKHCYDCGRDYEDHPRTSHFCHEADEDEIERLKAALKLAQEVLARVQWRGEGGFWEEGCCPECGALDPGTKSRTHYEDCDLKKLLEVKP